MSKQITVHYENKPCYEILLEQNFDRLIEGLQNVPFQREQKVCIVTDTNLEKYHLDKLKEVLTKYFYVVSIFVFPAGEENKHLGTVQKLYEHLIINKFDRNDFLIAFGGGVVGDLTGFTAATYLRGIPFVQIPTSLLSQVDSSIGGKTGVDFSQYKNMVGAFYQPKLVYMNLELLQTLPKEQLISGMGEIIKHGLIKDKDYYHWIVEHKTLIQELDIPTMEQMIYRSCNIKREVVEKDPKEKGERALLNFGHTIGHAVEKLSDFSLYHGHCVGIGMAAAAYLSMKLNHISTSEYKELLQVLKDFGLPVTIDRLDADKILETTKSDKKMLAGKIKFILLQEIGNAYINPELTDEQLLDAIAVISEAIHE